MDLEEVLQSDFVYYQVLEEVKVRIKLVPSSRGFGVEKLNCPLDESSREGLWNRLLNLNILLLLRVKLSDFNLTGLMQIFLLNPE